MKFRAFKYIRPDLEAIESIKNKDDLFAAVPLVVEAQEKMKSMRRLMDDVIKVLTEKVSEMCTAYAMAHTSVFEGGSLYKDGKGVEHGDLQIGDHKYHFAKGYKGLIRLDGGQNTQEFLDGLPKDWIKCRFDFDQTKMKSLGVTEDDLHKAGLVRRANNVWSLPDPTDAAESGE